jgi:methyl-accepting chemotaxis protein
MMSIRNKILIPTLVLIFIGLGIATYLNYRAGGEISNNIQGVNTAARESANSAGSLNSSAQELQQLSQVLQGIVGRFRV